MLKKMTVCFLVLYSSFSVAEIYKWTDEQGQVHYGDKSVVSAKQMEVDTSKQGHIKINDSREGKRQKLLDAYADDHKREKIAKTKHQKKLKKQKKKCVKSKDQLKRYERASSLYDLDKEGNRITISNMEREKRTMALHDKIKKYCK